MTLEILRTVFGRDLNKLFQEISLYQDESNLWIVEKGIANSGGNLCLHLVGNLQTYIGKELGGHPYVRDREAEFSSKNVPREILLQQVSHTKEVVDKTLAGLDPSMLGQDFPVLVFKEKTSVEYMLIHLATHLGYHLGQVNYHRRLLDVQ